MLEAQLRARDLRRRLWNPPGARSSSELEVLPRHAFQRRLLTSVENPEGKTVKMPALSEEQRKELYTQAFTECLTIMREALGDAGLIIAKELVERAGKDEDAAQVAEARTPRIVEVLRATCAFYNTSVADVISERRSAPVVRVRQIGMYLARTITLRSLPEIGRRFGNRDHTTAIHAVEKISNILKSDEDLKAEIAAIRKALGVG